ncbi:hypothetical protein JCM10212_006816 [Sporobolomyces blumeae]
MSKRRHESPPRTAGPPSKRTSTGPSTLTSFFATSSRPALPSPITASDPITDRQSTFVAHAAPVTNPVQASQFHQHVRALRTPAHPVDCDHEILAWRTMTLRVGRDGLKGEDDWTVRSGGDDDGEKQGASHVQAAIQASAAIDVAVVVSRLYGGILLGPVRFDHIERVAKQALERLASAQALGPLLDRLAELDAEIDQFSPAILTKPSERKTPGHTSTTGGCYAGIDIVKAERLVKAREKKLEFLKKRHREEEESLWGEVQRQEREEAAGGDDVGDEDDRREKKADTDQPLGDDQRTVRTSRRVVSSRRDHDDDDDDDDDEAALWASLDAQEPSASNVGADLAGDDDFGGLPSELDAAVAAAQLEVKRKKRERADA